MGRTGGPNAAQSLTPERAARPQPNPEESSSLDAVSDVPQIVVS
jgi:hypothetical protein